MVSRKVPSNATQAMWHKIVCFIAEYKQAHGGDTPSHREIGRHIGHESTSVVHHYLMGMERAGLIILPPQKSHHGIELPGEQYIPPPGLDKG